MSILESKYQLNAYAAGIASINYFNDIHKIIRIEFNKKLYDFKYLGGNEVPNPTKHIALVVTSNDFLNETQAISKERESFLPGIVDSVGNLTDLPMGFVLTIPKKQTISVSNPNAGGAGFSISKTNMFDLDKVAIALSAPLDKDYTNTEKDEQKSDRSNGIFINNDGTILIKSKGSSLTMGEEGIYIGGNVYWESSEHTREWMMDNQLHRFIPSTIVTFPLSIPELPNISKFAQIAEGARKVRNIISSVGSVSKIIGT